MADLTIITNNQPRECISYADLTDKEKKEFDYIDADKEADEDLGFRFFRYKGNVYDTQEFMGTYALHDDHAFKDWDGYAGDTYFSGTLIKYVDMDCDRVIVARYYC
jgi:hypothetical protein